MGWLKRILGRGESDQEEQTFTSPQDEHRRVTPAVGSPEEEQAMRERMERELEAQRARLPRE